MPTGHLALGALLSSTFFSPGRQTTDPRMSRGRIPESDSQTIGPQILNLEAEPHIPNLGRFQLCPGY
jgi:hypothetical protein